MKRIGSVVLATISGLAAAHPGSTLGNDLGARASGTQTNWVERWITNTAEVQMQRNRFVTEYHTNWTTVVRTNFVEAYQTNLRTLHLTNWTTVLAFQTNWVTKPLTNVVEIEMPREASGVVTPAPVAPAPAASTPKAAATGELLALQASRGARRVANNQVEVQLSVTWTQAPSTPVQVQQWRIEREDGSILCFGQDAEFKRTLPVGTYKVQVKAQRDAKSAPMAALGTLTVTAQEVSVQQKPARSNSST